MASNYTENYGLCQWENTDQVLRTEFNGDNSKIDTALKNQAGSIEALEEELKRKGNCSVVNMTYTGNGALTRTLTFERKPLLVVIASGTSRYITLFAVQGCPVGMGLYGSAMEITWSGNSFTWRRDNMYLEESYFCNESEKPYYVTAFLEE